MSDTDRAIALAVIDAIDEAGYLSESIEDIHAGLVGALDIELDEVEAVLHLIQHFDPVGVASRNLKECLLLQLQQFDQSSPKCAAPNSLLTIISTCSAVTITHD